MTNAQDVTERIVALVLDNSAERRILIESLSEAINTCVDTAALHRAVALARMYIAERTP